MFRDYAAERRHCVQQLRARSGAWAALPRTMAR
jgi:hypothetical protein